MILSKSVTTTQMLNKFKGLEDKFNTKYNNKFIYTDSFYQGMLIPIKIICPEHGVFLQTPARHLAQIWGCPQCAKLEKEKKQLGNTDEFIRRAKLIHGDAFDYTESIYINANSKIKIFCNSCNTFIHPLVSTHLGGAKCIHCIHKALNSNTTEFVTKALCVHKDKFDYSLVDYKDCKSKVDIICKTHGVFKQSPSNHLAGRGCPHCAHEIIHMNRYKNTPTIFYSFKYQGVFKVGITTKTPFDRYKGEGVDWDKITDLVEIKYNTFIEAYMFEQFLLCNYQEYRYFGEPIFRYTGNTEVFTENIYELYLQECKND